MPFVDFEEKTISVSGNKAIAQSMGDEGICNVLCPTTVVILPCELATTVNCDPVVVTPGPDPYYPPDPYQPPPSYNPCDPANPAYDYCNCYQCGPPPGSGGTCNDLGCGCGKPAPTTYYLDADGDGVGGTQTKKACTKPSGYVGFAVFLGGG